MSSHCHSLLGGRHRDTHIKLVKSKPLCYNLQFSFWLQLQVTAVFTVYDKYRALDRCLLLWLSPNVETYDKGPLSFHEESPFLKDKWSRIIPEYLFPVIIVNPTWKCLSMWFSQFYSQAIFLRSSLAHICRSFSHWLALCKCSRHACVRQWWFSCNACWWHCALWLRISPLLSTSRWLPAV